MKDAEGKHWKAIAEGLLSDLNKVRSEILVEKEKEEKESKISRYHQGRAYGLTFALIRLNQVERADSERRAEAAAEEFSGKPESD